MFVIRIKRFLVAFLLVLSFAAIAGAQNGRIPEALEPWKMWATWHDKDQGSPSTYTNADDRIATWASHLQLKANATGASWQTEMEVFDESWVGLPGSSDRWPIDVRVDGELVVVVQRSGLPFTKLPMGAATVSGKFSWQRMPQTIMVPSSIGMLDLTVNDEAVPVPNWDASGKVWLQRIRVGATDKDHISASVYRVIEDGIPVWLRTEIELTVSGKSREEELGTILPADWKLSKVNSKIPVAIDDAGAMKAQVRAGKWTISIDAFRADNPTEIAFADGATPIVDRELVGMKTNPRFRVAQLEGLPTIDASQTQFPSQWSGLPVYQWQTNQSFQLVQKMRGMGDRTQQGLTMHRRLWLDEDGAAFTYQDNFSGQMQQIWRLDVNDQNELGAVRIDGEPQLITTNPQTKTAGVEIRRRNLKLEAVGRTPRQAELSATGWQADADSLNVTLTLPPGWRALAVLGADDVRGDWLTAWSLLDLFLLLIFAFAVRKMFGNIAGVIALIALAISYHELGAPRFTWLFLLLPVGLSRVVGDGAAARWINVWKYGATALFLLCLIPFVARQTQDVLHPQLEPGGYVYGSRHAVGLPSDSFQKLSVGSVMKSKRGRADVETSVSDLSSTFESANLLQSPKSRIQTGPAQPQWEWNNVYCTWQGPVARDQVIRPILLSLWQTRLITIVRLALLMLIAGIVLRGSKLSLSFFKKRSTAAATIVAIVLLPTTASAQIPDADMLKTLRERLLETPDVFPDAAELPTVDIQLEGNRIEMDIEVHAAARVAVPLPGKLPAWSPISVQLDDQAAVVSRRDGYLWALVPSGVHRLTVSGLLPNEADWEWTFLLKPRYVSIDAEGWKVTGVDSNGVPDAQVFFVREQDLPDDQAAYDRTDFDPIVAVDRHLEIGLVSKVRTVVTRLSSTGKAVALQVPVLPNENVLTGRVNVENNTVNVRMNAMQNTFSWESELPYAADVALVADPTGNWVERWHLVTSPIWNVSLEGLEPIFDSNQLDLIPVWKPWPGENVTIKFSEPTAVSGDTMTVQELRHEISLGDRRRTHKMLFRLNCSLAGDFVVQLGADAEIASLKRDGQSIPVQRSADQLIIPAVPGTQTIELEWQTNQILGTVSVADQVRLPVTSSNVTRVMLVPDSRWVLWADGPLRGPAVRFWTILIVAVLAAIALGFINGSPLRRFEWVLLVIGLTQVHLVAAMIVVGWLFLLSWRGRSADLHAKPFAFNSTQILIVVSTIVSLLIFVFVVAEGLLGNPEMFVVGNGSTRTYLQWFQPRAGNDLPAVRVISISVWFYRFLMLCWALWLANALLRWLGWGWKQFNTNGAWITPEPTPPEEPVQARIVS